MLLKIGLCIPILNAGDFASKMVVALENQSIPINHFFILDSGSTDDSVQRFSLLGPEIYQIRRGSFDHGGTRQKAVECLADCDFIIFLTQDAIPFESHSFERLIYCFENERIGAVFGRQVPRKEAGPIEAHARLFNYPGQSRIKSAEDIPTLGLKTAFISNSFAAYRVDALKDVGGFPEHSIVSEDTYVAARMILGGWKVAYCADAQVFHSHNYSFCQEWQRYFDIGVFHARNPWVRDSFGEAEGEGFRFLKSELKYLAVQSPHLIISAFLRNLIRFGGFRTGLLERNIPMRFKKMMSMQKSFWDQEE